MVYTIGYTLNYDKLLIEMGPEFKKLGFVKDYNKDGYVDYPGGSVWRDAREAYEYILLQEALGQKVTRYTYSVYEVDADWEKDTANAGDDWNNLIPTSRITRKVEF